MNNKNAHRIVPDPTDSNTILAAQASIDRSHDSIDATSPGSHLEGELPEDLLCHLRSLLADRASQLSPNGDDGDRPGLTALGPAEKHSFDVPIGRFRVKRLLGEGGFGVVFFAHDSRLGRDVALKLPRMRRPSKRAQLAQQKRAVREAAIAAKFDHPGIVPVFDSGHIGSLWYIVSAYCDGPTLHDWSRNAQPVAPKTAAELVARIADAVQHAHSRGILHRDLKPSNVLLKINNETGPDQLPWPQLTDFGLSSRLSSAKRNQRTRLVGTLPFMSPEQTRDDPTKLSIASDIYSLGAMLFDVLAGRPPYQDDGTIAMLEAIRHTPPPSLLTLRPDVSLDLDAICLKCLNKEPDQRYMTAADLALDLRRFLVGHCVTARRVSHPVRFWRWCRRKPVLAGVIGLLIVGSIAAFVLVTSAWRHERAAHAKAEARYHTAKKSVNDTYVKLATELLIDEPRKEELRKAFLQKALAFYEEIAAERSYDEESSYDLQVALHEIANLSGQLGQLEAANQYRTRCLSIVDNLVDRSPTNTKYRFASLHNRLLWGGQLATAGKLHEARESLTRACNEIETLVAEYPLDISFQKAWLSCNLTLAEHSIWSNEPPLSALRLQRVLARIDSISDAAPSGTYEPFLTHAYKLQAEFAVKNSDPVQAEHYYAKAVEIARENLRNAAGSGDLRYELAALLSYQADALWSLGRQSDSEVVAIETAGILATLCDEFPLIRRHWRFRSNFFEQHGQRWWATGQTDKANEYFSLAIKIGEEILANDPKDDWARELLMRSYEDCPDERLRNMERARLLAAASRSVTK